jgi:uncharacterized membrane protein YfcA
MLDLIGALDADVAVGIAVTAAVAGLVRGFSGFGSAMIFIPVASALSGPHSAVVMLFVCDTLLTVPLVVSAVRTCAWREVIPLAAGALATVPFGIWLLVVADPTLMRWIISLLILTLVAVLASGWRWRREPTRPMTVAVGGASGLTGGMTGLGGPPVILFWMAGQDLPATVRANVIVFLTLTGTFNFIGYVVGGLLTEERVASGLAIAPAYGLPLLLGVRLFRFTTPRFFRGLAFGLCAAAALMSMPAFGGLG